MKPFRSEAQKSKLLQMVKDGKLSQDAYNKMYLATLKTMQPLQARIHPKKKDLK